MDNNPCESFDYATRYEGLRIAFFRNLSDVPSRLRLGRGAPNGRIPSRTMQFYENFSQIFAWVGLPLSIPLLLTVTPNSPRTCASRTSGQHFVWEHQTRAVGSTRGLNGAASPHQDPAGHPRCAHPPRLRLPLRPRPGGQARLQGEGVDRGGQQWGGGRGGCHRPCLPAALACSCLRPWAKYADLYHSCSGPSSQSSFGTCLVWGTPGAIMAGGVLMDLLIHINDGQASELLRNSKVPFWALGGNCDGTGRRLAP